MSEKTYEDYHARLIIKAFDHGTVYVGAQRMDDEIGTLAGLVVSPKRARKIALSILAAADEAEGVRPVPATEDRTGYGLSDDGSEWRVFVEESADGDGTVWVGGGRHRDFCRSGAHLPRKTARALALAILRTAR